MGVYSVDSCKLLATSFKLNAFASKLAACSLKLAAAFLSSCAGFADVEAGFFGFLAAAFEAFELLLGLGGGSVNKSLRRNFRYSGKIEAVEVDPVMINIANKQFGVVKDRRTQIECCEAFQYLKKETKKFDLVIVDLFIDNRVSEKILSGDFWSALKDRVSPGGYIIFNSMHENYSITTSVKNEIRKWGFSIK